MKRRQFLKAAPVMTLPFLIKGHPVEAMATSPLLQLLGQQSLENGRVLVLVQLNGGNDGLNTVLSLDRYSDLSKARSNILIPQASALTLNGTLNTALHPSMTEMQGLYNNGMLNIVQGVSYPTPSFSHFRATDIWLTGADNAKNEYLSTGWLGRTIDSQYVDYPDTQPAYPLAVQIGSQASTITQTAQTNAAFTVTDPANFYKLVTPPTGPSTQTTPYGIELDFLRSIQLSTNKFAQVIINANSGGANLATYPANNSLANQLKIVARLIKGGLPTPIYIVNHPNSFDTHSGQLTTHANILGILSKAIGAFQQDLGLLGIKDRVTGMTFTEFGRRIASNANAGTDHGTAIPMFFFGSKVNPAGLTGASPVITNSTTGALLDNMPMQYDFRQVYYTVLRDWFQIPDTELSTVLPLSSSLPIFNQAALPVNILSFTGEWKNSQAALHWSVDQEIGIANYEIERSEDGITFTKIGTVTAQNVTIKHEYTFYDGNLHQTYYYYRIKVIEKSASAKYSSILLLKNSNALNGVRVKILPNPIDDWFVTAFQDKVSGHITARLLDLSGREIWKDEQQATDAFNLTFRFNRKIAPGVYVIQVRDNEHEANSKVLVR